MSGISSKAANSLENKYQYNGKEKQSKEFSDCSGLECMDYGARMYDGQIGSWNHIDPHVSNYYWLSPYNYCNNDPKKYLDLSGMDPETSTPDKPKELDEAVVTKRKPKQNNSFANRAFGWAHFDKQVSQQWNDERRVYEHARQKGWSEEAMRKAWSGAGISDAKLASYESSYLAEQYYYRTMSLVIVTSYGAPLAATYGGFAATGTYGYGVISSTATNLFAGSVKARVAAMASEFGTQYFYNSMRYGLGLRNLKNINIAAVANVGLMPGSGIGANIGTAITSNVFAVNVENGYSGIGSKTTLTNILVNTGLDFMGNRVGAVHGNVMGDLIGNGAQNIFNGYYDLNNK